jgi:hypothetical protein
MPLSGMGNNLCHEADIPNSKEGIEGYYRHAIKFNNVNGTMCIRTSLDMGKLKRPGSSFHRYLDDKRAYINKAQLETEEGLSLAWIHKAHPAFAFRDGMKEQLQALIGRFKQVEGKQQHFLPVVAVTGSGLQIREWVERLLKEKEMTGVISGFMFLAKDGKTVQATDFEEALIECNGFRKTRWELFRSPLTYGPSLG